MIHRKGTIGRCTTMNISKKWRFIFLLPATALFLFVYAVPVATLIGTSFTEWIVASEPVFIGIDNYIELFSDEEFLQATWNTIIWMFLQSTIHIAIGVMLALILARKKFYWKFTRTVFMLPNIISSAAVGMLFVLLLNPSFGAVNSVLTQLGFTDLPNWFMSRETSFISVTMTWLPYAGIVTILLMAEMTSLSDSIMEAAIMDGATEMQKNIYIVLPLTKTIIGTTTILGATSMLQKLDLVMMTTKGAPGNMTMNLPLYVYNTAFIANDFGLANTSGVLMIILGLVAVAIINRIYKTENHYY
ncbi:carbohydrate ABC transporter permease [Vallitalea okinawensis]|uniref:carbohydrate ABC transporter permease n=1 Tax=Vallitalea okinawensis TaxID=2078660 RepID=UPI001FA831C0|nr:sugar ABC transporter permease [Vallitalea okinawensis]